MVVTVQLDFTETVIINVKTLMNAKKKVLVSVMAAVVRTLGVVMIVSAKEVFYI